MKWKKCLLSDFFDIKTTKSVDKNKIEFKDNAPYDFIGRTSTGWGIQGVVDKLDFAPNSKDSFSLVQVGETVALWREREWYASQNLFLLQPKLQKIKDVFLYFQAVINKEMSLYGKDYNNYPTMKSLNKTHILLPVKTKYIPDFNLMSEIIGGGISMSNVDTSSWKEFRLVDIARLDNGNKMDKNKMTHLNPSVNFVSRTATNNGVSDVVDIVDGIEPYPAGCITLAFGGSVGSCFLQEEPFYTGQNVGVILLPDNITREAKIFLVSALEKKCKMSFHAFGNEINKHFKTDLSIKLPVKETEEIDWEYMQERITELEQERITELEQYLIATGLNDYELTDEDKDILATKLTDGVVLQNSISGNGCLKETAEFKISDVFDLYKGKRLTKAEHTCGNTPFIGSTDSNNGVTGYIGQEPIFSGDAITISYNGSVGQVFYQENDFWASDDINVLYLKNHVLNSLLYGYLSGALKKAGSKFSYSYKWNLERMKETLIVLPIQTDANDIPVIDQNHTYHPDGYVPDWTYMEKYIRAIEKVVIKDVVDYKDSIIAKTKEIVV